MKSGLLRRRVVIEQKTSTQDDLGQPGITWSEVITTWAQIKPMSGKELMAANASMEQVNTSIIIRYRPGITAAMRVNYNGKLFNILSVIDEGDRHRMLTLVCVEGLAEG